MKLLLAILLTVLICSIKISILDACMDEEIIPHFEETNTPIDHLNYKHLTDARMRTSTRKLI